MGRKFDSLATVNDDLCVGCTDPKQKITRNAINITVYSPEMFRIPANTGANMTVI